MPLIQSPMKNQSTFILQKTVYTQKTQSRNVEMILLLVPEINSTALYIATRTPTGIIPLFFSRLLMPKTKLVLRKQTRILDFSFELSNAFLQVGSCTFVYQSSKNEVRYITTSCFSIYHLSKQEYLKICGVLELLESKLLAE